MNGHADMSPLRGRDLRRLVMATGLPASKAALHIGVPQWQLKRAMQPSGAVRIPQEAAAKLAALVRASLRHIAMRLGAYKL